MAHLIEVPEDVYTAYFPQIYQYFCDEVHGDDHYSHEMLNIPGTWLKICELVADTGTVIFRVLLKATYTPLYPAQDHPRDLPELSMLLNTQTQHNITIATSPQLSYIQLDADNIPVAAILYTYSGHDNSYHTIALQ